MPELRFLAPRPARLLASRPLPRRTPGGSLIFKGDKWIMKTPMIGMRLVGSSRGSSRVAAPGKWAGVRTAPGSGTAVGTRRAARDHIATRRETYRLFLNQAVKMRPSTAAWIALGIGTIGYEVLASDDELLSVAVDRWLEDHRAVTVATIAITAAHLLNLLPSQADPFIYLLKGKKWLQRPTGRGYPSA